MCVCVCVCVLILLLRVIFLQHDSVNTLTVEEHYSDSVAIIVQLSYIYMVLLFFAMRV